MKNVKDKIDKMAPLSAGIVFGKEEAWDKLQARMDKPAKRIALKPWLAAAAVLLLMVTVITAYYNIPAEQEIVKEEPKKMINTPRPPDVPLPVVQATESSSPAIHIPVREGKDKRPIAHEQEKQIIQTEQVQVAEAIPASAPVDEVLVMNNTTPALPSKIPTKVAHINELDNHANPTSAFASNYASPVNIKKLRVVHLNDVVQQEYTLQTIIRDNSLRIGQLYFIKPGYMYNTPGEPLINQRYDNSLNIKINIQN